MFFKKKVTKPEDPRPKIVTLHRHGMEPENVPCAYVTTENGALIFWEIETVANGEPQHRQFRIVAAGIWSEISRDPA